MRRRVMPRGIYGYIHWVWYQWVLVCSGVLIGVWAVTVVPLWVYRDGSRWWFVALLGGVALLVTTAQIARSMLGRSVMPVSRLVVGRVGGRSGLLVPGTRRADVITVVAAGLWTVTFGLAGVLAVDGWRVASFVTAGLFALLMVLVWVRLVRYERWLLLTPEGLYLSVGLREGWLAWDDVESILWALATPQSLGFVVTGPVGAPSWESIRRPPGRRTPAHLPRLEVEALSFDLDPMLLGLALGSYWQFPHLRSELVTGHVTAQRLVDASFAMSMTPPEVRAAFAPYRPQGARP